MGFENFIKEIGERVAKATGEMVKATKVMKINGVELQGITVYSTDRKIHSTIYLERYYEDFKFGRTLADITEAITNLYNEGKQQNNVEVTFLYNFEAIKDRIVYKVINANANDELLKHVPHKKIHDLAKVYYIELADRGEGVRASVLIKNTLLKEWGVDEAEVFALAEENTEVLCPAKIVFMSDILGELGVGIENDASVQMYVISNEKNYNGAAAIFYENTLKVFADFLKSDLYILPSSLHECILLPAEKGMDVKGLKEMVHEVNRTQVEKEEVLSDSVYIYNRETNTIEIA